MKAIAVWERNNADASHAQRADAMKPGPRVRSWRVDPLAGIELFPGLTEEESRRVLRRMEEKRIPRGATIFRKDDRCDSLFALKEGLVKLESRPEKGSGTILYVFRPPDIFGELLLAEERRPFNAVAMTDVLAGVLSREDFLGLLSAIPQFRLNFIRILSRRLVRAEKGVTEFSHTRSYHRLARVLLRMCGEFGEETPRGVRLRLSLTHADLAEMIGTTRETVTNQLIRFNRLGLVDACGRHLFVNRRRLANYAHGGEYRREGKEAATKKSA